MRAAGENGDVTRIVPASITCMFTPKREKDPKLSGSYGVGIALRNGSKAVCRKSEREETVFLGCRNVRTVELALSFLKARYSTGKFRLELKPNYPIGCGFGMSASLTLSALTVTAELFDLPLKDIADVADIAHEAEVVSSTGLGDVVTQVHGGIVCRLEAVCPSLAKVKKVSLPLRSLDLLVLGELDTGEALEEYDFSTGLKRMKEFLKNPTVEGLFYHSKAFALECGIMDEDVLDVIEAVEAAGGMASMVMLGKAVFAVNGFEAMREFGKPFRAEIDFEGLRFRA